MKKDSITNDLRRRQEPEVVHTVADLRDLIARLEQRAAILRSIETDLTRRYVNYGSRDSPPEKLWVNGVLVVPSKAVVDQIRGELTAGWMLACERLRALGKLPVRRVELQALEPLLDE